MRRIWLLLACVFAVSGLAGGVAMTARAQGRAAASEWAVDTDQQQADVSKVGVWQPPSGLKQTQIWPNGAPIWRMSSNQPRELRSRKPRILLRGVPTRQSMT